MDPILMSVLVGAGVALARALVSWLNSDKPFQPKPFVSSVITGALLGLGGSTPEGSALWSIVGLILGKELFAANKVYTADELMKLLAETKAAMAKVVHISVPIPSACTPS